MKEEKIKHTYPHCRRCDTPLLNWAANSWFVKVSALKQKLLRQNATIHWVPGHVGQARFRNGLETAPDWAISRSRYWGAPLPVWRNHKTKEIKVAGSVNEVLAMARRSGNRYFVMRHGEAHSNITRTDDSGNLSSNHLTDDGKRNAAASAQKLQKEGINLILVSSSPRAQETARIVQKELQLPDECFITEPRLGEINFGIYDGRPLKEWMDFFTYFGERFLKAPQGGESYADMRRRVGELLFEVEQQYRNKGILLVTHGAPGWVMMRVAERISNATLSSLQSKEYGLLKKAEYLEMPFVPFPHNQNYELDVHRPYIDELDTGEWKRISDVFDCWFESGSMPYASHHYPFRKKVFDPKGFFGWGTKGYPADFIAEGLDQTRGWFYSLIVLGTALFGKTPYKNVIVNGLILASDGQKMSKRLRNYPDPMEVVEKYGADALRYYLLSSPLLRGEDLRFQEKGVDEVSKKIIMRLDNVRSFYELYADGTAAHAMSTHALDRWILTRLGELVRDTTKGFEQYELDAAARPLGTFVDDLSTWYLRRSRDRFKSADNKDALATLRLVLETLAKVMAPILPFFADDLWQRLHEGPGAEVSVHLTTWPQELPIDTTLLKDMEQVRTLVSLGLELRERAGIKVRQPLGRLEAKVVPVEEELQALVRDELNIKELVHDSNLNTDARLDTEITPELREEGKLREWIRTIQEWRKEAGLKMTDRPGILVRGPDAPFIRKHREALMDATGIMSLEVQDAEEITFERL